MLMDKIGISLETLDGEDRGKMIAQCETERDEFEMAEITSPMEAKVLLKWWAVEKLSRQVIALQANFMVQSCFRHTACVVYM